MATLVYLPLGLNNSQKDYKIPVKLASVTHQQAWPMETLGIVLRPLGCPQQSNSMCWD